MEFRRISDYIPYIDDSYYLSEYGDVYWRVKSYNGSYKVNLRIDNKSKQVTITKYIKPFLNTNVTKNIMPDVWIIDGKPYSKRYLTQEHTGYFRIHLYEKDSKIRHRFSVHKLVNLIYSGCSLDLDTHHIDGNKLNNHYSNLIGLTKSEHRKLHIDQGIMQKYEQFTAVHNGIEGVVTCDMKTFCNLTNVSYRAIIRGYTADKTWYFKDFVERK